MSVIVPSGDGEINQYNLTRSSAHTPRIYFVNGIRVNGRDPVSYTHLTLPTIYSV